MTNKHNRTFITVPGGHELATFCKVVNPTGKVPGYSEEVKRTIVAQYCQLRRDSMYNQTKALATLAKLHELSPTTIYNWYARLGDTIVTPMIKKDKPKTKVKTSNKEAESLVNSLISKDSQSTLDKFTQLLKLIPTIEISISINPK